jgi:precorrin-6Y C5,15-methyltransferase (decarboxylating)
VRVVSISKLALRDDSIVWDVGAGAGSVSIEAAIQVRRGQVFAVERGAEDAEIIRQNVAHFGLRNIVVVEANAPEALADLPDPDAVFVGGSGGGMREVIAVIATRLRPGGRVVVNVATVESLSLAIAALREKGFDPELTQISVARSQAIGTLTRLAALDPVFIVSGTR